jgi:hypothetical protein
MRRNLLVFLTLLLPAIPAFATGLQLTLNPAIQAGIPGGSVIFSGTLVDTDTDSSFLFLNDLSVLFTPPADSYLSVDPTFFFNTVPGDLFGDGITGDDTYTGPLFEIYIAPDTPWGNYSGTINILGGYNGPGADFDPLLVTPVDFQVVVAPEPTTLLLTMAGIAGIAIIKRRCA